MLASRWLRWDRASSESGDALVKSASGKCASLAPIRPVKRRLRQLEYPAVYLDVAYTDSGAPLKRYPIQGTVVMYSGLSGFSSIFFRRFFMKTRR